MQILSYKILNEATIDLFKSNDTKLGGEISKNLLKSTKIQKDKGVSDLENELITYTKIISIVFNFYDSLNNRYLLSENINQTFGLYFSNNGNVVNLIPYYSNEILSLVGDNKDYLRLKLFIRDNNNQIIDYNIENYFNSYQPLRFIFSLEIPNVYSFKELNKKHNLNSLNILENFISTNINTNFNPNIHIEFMNMSGIKQLKNNKDNNQINYNNISFKIKIPNVSQNLINQINQINNDFSNLVTNCKLIFNRATPPSGYRKKGRFLSSIEYNSTIIYIDSVNSINTNRNIPIDIPNVYIFSIGNINITQPFLSDLTITQLS